MNTPQSDPTNPFHLASFYVEDLKYGDRQGEIVRTSAAEFDHMITRLLYDAGLEGLIEPERLRGALSYYGDSFAISFNTTPELALSVFVDGVLHGIALAGGLHGQTRNPKGE